MPFLRRVLDTHDFSAGNVHTAFIAQHETALLPSAPSIPPPSLMKLAALRWIHAQGQALAASLPSNSVWANLAFTRLGGGLAGGAGSSPLRLQPLGFDGEPNGDPSYAFTRRALAGPEDPDNAGAAFELALVPEFEGAEGDSWSTCRLVECDDSDRSFRAVVDGESISGNAICAVGVANGDEPMSGTIVDMFVGGERASVLVSDVAQLAQERLSTNSASGSAVANAVYSPMPGKIIRVLVDKGQAVNQGDPVVVMEAMKMEHTMKAPVCGHTPLSACLHHRLQSLTALGVCRQMS